MILLYRISEVKTFMRLSRIITTASAVIFLPLATVLVADEATLRTDTNLYAAAQTDAKVTASLKSGTKVTIIKQKYAWYEVKYGPFLQGWVPLKSLQITTGKTFATYLDQLPKPVKAVEREDVESMFSEAGDEPDTIVTGVRALSSENIASVEPDAEAVKALERYAVDKSQASNFASELGLKTREIQYLVQAEEETTVPAKETNDDDF
jgi:uncharacterized protein YgiM (DUF1202 family)